MRIPIALYALALVARAVLIVLHPDAAYPDSYYYSDVARSIAEGRGLTVDFVWIFAEVGGRIPADPSLPIPSNGHWMPLASLVQVPFLVLFGPSPHAAAAPFALIGSLAAPLAWAIARDAGSPPLVAVGAGIMTALPALTFVFMVQPDNFSLYQPLAAGALWLAARGLKGDARAFALGGLLVGLATLSRNDGVFVGAVLAAAFAWDRGRAWRSAGRRAPAIPVRAAVACFGLFVLVLGPWIWRQLATFGQISPSTASGKVLFIRSIEEWNSITTPATLEHLLGQGTGPFLASRVLGLVAAAWIFATLAAARLLIVPMLVGAWQRRRSVDFGPFFAYAGLLFAFSGLVSAVHVPGGTFIHSAVALVPHAYVLALEGVVVAVAWVAARRPAWRRETATRLFVAVTVGFAALTAVAAVPVVHADWAATRAERLAVGAALDLAGAAPDARLMTIDAAGYRYFTGRGGVVSPNDPLETVEAVARAYAVEWLVIERNDTVPALAPVLRGEAREAWIGPRVYEIPAPDGGPPRVAVHPVCLSPTDIRCVVTADRR